MTRFLGISSLALITVAMSAAPAFAGNKVLFRCSNGEEINLKLTQASNGEIAASVITQSVGDSYPEFHYRNLKSDVKPGVMGGAVTYSGKGFEVHIVPTALNEPAVLDIPSIGINNEELSCK